MKRRSASISVIIAAVMWGTMGIWVRNLEVFGFTSMELVLARSIGAAVLLTLFLLIYDRKLLRVRLRDLWCFLGTGLVSIVFFSYCYFTTITLTNLSVAAALLYTAPAFVVLMSRIFFKEKLTAGKILALIAALIGCILVSGVIGGGGLTMKGVLLGIGSGLGYAMYSIFGREALNRGYHSFTITVYTFYFATPGALLLANPAGLVKKAAEAPVSLLWLTGVIVVTTVLPYIFYTLGLSGMEASYASILACAEPLTAALIGIFAYREIPGVLTVLGILLVLSATVLTQIRPGVQKEIEKN